MPALSSITPQTSGNSASELLMRDGALFRVVSVTSLKTWAALNNVNNTADSNKPISAATQAALDAINASLSSAVPAAITASGPFPARTNERTQIVVVNSANAVALAMSAGQFPVGDDKSVLLYKYGAGTLTLTGLTTRGDPPTLTGQGLMVLLADAINADQPHVAVQQG